MSMRCALVEVLQSVVRTTMKTSQLARHAIALLLIAGACSSTAIESIENDAATPAPEVLHAAVMRPTRTPNNPPAPPPASSNATYHGGAVLANVQVVPVFWTNRVNATVRSEIHCFFSAAVSGSYMDWLAEYNTPTQQIGRGSVANNVTITPAHTGLTLLDADIQDEIVRQIVSGTLPEPTANTLYMIYFPPGVSIRDPFDQQSCVDFCAYHYASSYNGSQIR